MPYKVTKVSVKSMSGLLKLIITCTIVIWIYFLIFDFLKSERIEKFKQVAQSQNQMTEKFVDISPYSQHMRLTRKFYEERKGIHLSNLGRILFLNEPAPYPKEKTFKILIWKNGKVLENRHMKSPSGKLRNPFELCSVGNCVITYDDGNLDVADAVVVDLDLVSSDKDYPNPKRPRPPDQRWVFLADDGAASGSEYDWKSLNGAFNWSMTYKWESDVPVPCGRSEPMPNYIPVKPGPAEQIMELVPFGNTKRRDVVVATVMNDCEGYAMEYIKELGGILGVDVYGQCGTDLKKTCPGSSTKDCPELRQYLFYLAFETVTCDQYMTENLYWNAYKNGAIPVILGSSRNFSKINLPPLSYLHAVDYARPRDLATHLLLMNRTWNNELFRYHEWRRHYRVLNEHGFFGSRSVHYCRMCEALNFNDNKPKVYDDLSFYLDPDQNCKF